MTLPPRNTPWDRLYELGFRHVACLCSERPLYDPTPLEWLVTAELCDLAEVPLPEDPVAEERAIRLISRAVQAKLSAGEGVIVHCAGGRGRTGTVLGCAMRGLGYPADEVVRFLDEVHRFRGKPGWPEAPWQQEVVERNPRGT
jgi:protein-tyrosine phosphatase